jgi:hypothetical protein
MEVLIGVDVCLVPLLRARDQLFLSSDISSQELGGRVARSPVAD